MFKKLIIPTIVMLAFASNASALNQKGKFKKNTHKISGSWTLVEVEGKQVLAFGKKFKTEEASNLTLVLSKKTVRSLKKNPNLNAPLKLADLKSSTGDQYYVFPSNVDLSEYESIIIHNAADNVIWGGFDIPAERSRNENSGSVFEEAETYGS